MADTGDDMTTPRETATAAQPAPQHAGPRDDNASIRKSLTRYRVMAWIVGTLLVLLMCVAMPLKYFADQPQYVTWIGIVHGWLFVALLITAYDLGRRANWAWWHFVLIAVSGLVPFATFVAEWFVTRDVKRLMAR